ncbi:ABC transporter permease [Schumannella luteola]|uniref:Peptide/nickel transport system permease protein n=1 Tax=Schumannella luteola TaxID=472059 RepID=A0A852YBK4_9MICO|nr:ABC transporter permease [Schumannella luteola]NYG98571.1 peptide/nickel transport system permease protein [Schumannella luteola]TPX02552.1 ABC transporter permease [Schumannella luteola]
MSVQMDPVAADPTSTATLTAVAVRSKRGRRVQFGILRNRKAMVGIVVLAIFILLAIIGPWIAPYNPDTVTPEGLQPPSPEHWLGTTATGQDILSQLLVGTRGVMLVGLTAGIVATLISVIVGVVSGFVGGIGDEILSLISNVFLVIPALPLIIIITGLLPGAGGLTVAFVIAVTGWAWGARVMRAQTLSLRRRDFVEAARANGEPLWRIVFFEIMPNLTAIIASGFIGTVIFAILSEVTLAFIGVTSISDWNWGTVLFWAQSSQALVQGAWWWFVPAGLCIAAVGTSLTLINFGIDEFVNPRLRSTAANAGVLRRKKIRARIGFTPVYRGAAARGQKEAQR